MDRVTVYAGAIPLETDILRTNRNVMVGLGALAKALFGTATFANGFACMPTSPASMQVQVGPGEVYAQDNVDGTAYSSLAADTAHQTIKQGLQNTGFNLSCPAPTTAGQSINYLIQVGFSEVDRDGVVLPYYNSSNPAEAYSGPANSGAAQPTTRAGTVLLTAKAGVSATTGSQTTPAPDAGFIGLYVVTVAYGATTITSGNIAAIAGAPAVPAAGIIGGIQNGSFLYGAAGGTANALTVAITPAPTALIAGMEVVIKAAAANTAGATLNLNGLGAKTITANGGALKAGMLQNGQLYALIYDGTNWQLQSPTQSGIVAYSYGATSNYEVYANGKIEQWGKVALPTGTGTVSAPITFPIAFPTAATWASGNADNSANSSWGWLGIECQALTLTGMNVVADAANQTQAIAAGRNAYWSARGY